MRPKERWETGEQDLFRARLDQIIDMRSACADDRLAVPGGEVRSGLHRQARSSAVDDAADGRPRHNSYDLSDEGLCERWVENPYFQYFFGQEFFQHRLVDRSSLTRWRQRMGEVSFRCFCKRAWRWR
jgi:transposase, IS5 family